MVVIHCVCMVPCSNVVGGANTFSLVSRVSSWKRNIKEFGWSKVGRRLLSCLSGPEKDYVFLKHHQVNATLLGSNYKRFHPLSLPDVSEPIFAWIDILRRIRIASDFQATKGLFPPPASSLSHLCEIWEDHAVINHWNRCNERSRFTANPLNVDHSMTGR